MKAFIKLSLLAVVLLMASCTTTQIVSSWTMSNPPADVAKKMLVVGVMQDRGQRDNIEQAMVAELNKAGISSASAMTLFGPNGFQGLKEEQINEKLKNSGYSSVMIVSLVDKKREASFSPGYYYSAPYPVGYSLYYRRYMYAYDYMYTPGYFSVSTNYVLQADLYTATPDQLVYSAQTQTYDPENAQDLATSFAKAIVTDMKTKKLIQ